MKGVQTLLAISLSFVSINANNKATTRATQPPFYSVSGNWAAQTLKQLTLEQKIGQLFMVTVIIDQEANAALVAQKGKIYRTDLAYAQQLIQEYHIGGIIFLGLGNTKQQAQTTQELQALSPIPLLIGLDCEWGLSMRLLDAPKFPKNMALGALTNNAIIYQMAREIAQQCKQLGVHINFAPVVDVNNNPNNSIINDRSFGCNKEAVATKAIAYMRGLQDCGVLACAKHFPGHGDTTVDSHKDLPIITHSQERIQDIELYPFQKIIQAGVASVMMAHLSIPALEPATNTPSSMSHTIVTDLLKQRMTFSGLCITDGLDMQGVHKHHKPGNIELHALLAGNDILLCPTDVPKAVELIKQAIKDGLITEEEINKRVHKILRAKEWALNNAQKNKTEHSPTTNAHNIKKQIYEQAITIAQNKSKLIQITQSSMETLAYVRISTTDACNAFEKTAQLTCARYHLHTQATNVQINDLLHELTNKNTIVVTLHDMQRSPSTRFGITDSTLQFLQSLHAAHKKIILIIFGNAYSVKLFENYADTIIVAYDEEPEAQDAAARVLTGSLHTTGTMPI